MLPHRFIVIEGIDGAGTTTVSHAIVQFLERAGMRAIWTCEPTKGAVGTMIRRILRGEERALDRFAMAALFTADRIDHVRTWIEPFLREPRTYVVCDRYYYSTLLYQELNQSLQHSEWFRNMSSVVLSPDITIVLDALPATAKQRRIARGGDPEMFEDDHTQSRLASGYLSLQDYMPDDFIVHVDADRDVEDVTRAAIAAMWRLPSRTHKYWTTRYEQYLAAMLGTEVGTHERFFVAMAEQLQAGV